MVEELRRLPAGARVLDLGCGPGSFVVERRDLRVVRLDLQPPSLRKAGLFVSADAARLPFADGCFHAVVSNHSLEHFTGMESALAEVGRVIGPGGMFLVAVPDANTVTDRIYRWLGRGGGHVNAFRHPEDVIAPVERLTGLPHRHTRTLYSSLSFLNNHNFSAPPPKRIALFAFGDERFLAALVWALRLIGRHSGNSWSAYGWELRFGAAEPPEDPEPWINVCVRCGGGHSEAWLRSKGAGRFYHCPDCGGWNIMTRR